MKIKIAFIISIITILFAGAVAIKIIRNKPPEREVIEAGRMLAEAQIERSPGFAKELFHEASMYYDSAMIEWKIQNEKFIPFRNYREVTELAKKSMERSEQAIYKARQTISETEGLLKMRIEKLGDKIKEFEKDFSSFPLSKKHRDDFAKCKLLYSESLHSYNSKSYAICKSKLDSVESVINDISIHYRDKLTDYFGDYSKWNEMVKQAISYSRKSQTYVIVVDKIARELFIYKNGKITKRYPIELGPNWLGNKMQQGDGSTPEGIYKIVSKKQNGQTRYHRAFLLDYPNQDDKARFSLNKKNGIVELDSRIGGLIEIHGNGGKGIDWTEGCIALNDTNMDEIFKLCPVGTRVTIVGSVKSLKELSFSLK